MTGTNTRRRRNPTQADIIHTMLVQEVAKAQKAVHEAPAEQRDEARAARNALSLFEARVKRYLDGDTSALYV